MLGVLHSTSLAVSAIGLSLAQAHGLKAKHATKQVDRLLSNPGVDLGRLFTPWIRQAIGDDREIVVAMDWTDFDADDQSTLMLSLVTTYGRAQPLLWLTVYKAELTGRRNEFEDLCLARLKEALPEGVRVTILADRGFADVRLMEFLLRTRLRLRDPVSRRHVRERHRRRNSQGDAQWVGASGRARKLTGAKLTREGFEVGACVHVHAKGMKEAWHLAASDGAKSAKAIVGLYAKRWTIEPSFRDTKDLRFGMGMAELRIADPMRRDRLLFLNALAILLLTSARRRRREPRHGQGLANQHDQAPNPLPVPSRVHVVRSHPQHARAPPPTPPHQIRRNDQSKQSPSQRPNSCRKMRGFMSRRAGVNDLRTSRPKMPHSVFERREIPDSGLQRRCAGARKSKVTASLAAGVTLHEALKAADQLKPAGVATSRDRSRPA